jgi:DNA ligase (NAD+)
MSELNSFITKLQRLDDAYYQGKPRMTDENYDILRDQVLDLHNANPTKQSKEYFSKRANSLKADVKAGRRTAELPIPMLSLNKVNTNHEKNLTRFIDTIDSTFDIALKKLRKGLKGDKVKEGLLLDSMRRLIERHDNDRLIGDYIVSPKLDGLSLLLEYTGGKLTRAYTGGDGYTGQDKTIHMKTLAKANLACGFPLELKYKNKLREEKVLVKGELVVDVRSFKKFWRNTADPRSCINHYLNGDKPLSHHEGITFVAYEAKSVTPTGKILNYPNTCIKDDTLLYLVRNGFNCISLLKNFGYINKSNNDYKLFMNYLDSTMNIQKHIHDYLKEEDENKLSGDCFAYVNALPYLCDGLVIDTNYRHVQRLLGENTAYPNYAIAIKQDPSNQIGDTTTVTEVVYETSKSGALKPVVHFEPINIGGVNISKASGVHYQYVVNNKLGKGAEIKVVRSGGVIPRIVETVKGGKVKTIDKLSCDCGGTLEQHSTDLYCTNNDCPIVETAIMRNAFKLSNVKGIGGKTVDKVSNDYNLIQFMQANPIEFVSYGKAIGKVLRNVQLAISEMSVPELMAVSGVFTGKGMSLSVNLLEQAFVESDKCKNLDKLYSLHGFGEKRADFFKSRLGRFKKFYKAIKVSKE